MNNTLNLAIRKAARKLSVDQKLVEDVYRSYWNFIKTRVSSVSLKEISEEEFSLLDINFNLPLLGKLYVEYSKIERYRKRIKKLENAETEKNKADRLPGVDN